MKLFPLNKNTLALLLIAAVTVGFFVGGLLEILDYFIVKILLFASVLALAIAAFYLSNK